MSEEIEQCPFCGESGAICEYESDHSNEINVRCQNCFASSDRFPSSSEAIAAWNCRRGVFKDKLPPEGFARIHYEDGKCVITPWPPIYESSKDV